jgi:spore maturation protein A
MLNKIWFWLLCIGIVYGFCKAAYQSTFPSAVAPAAANAKVEAGKNGVATAQQSKATSPTAPTANAQPPESALTTMGKRLNAAVLEATKSSIEICIPLIGIMALWLGLLNVAKDAGVINVFARIMRPLVLWLFPEVPDGHPAQGAMLMNFAANMLGLDNAATPMGLKAMEELQKLNPVNDTATNSMAQFLAINCGSITLIPFTIIGYRFVSGSKDPSGIIVGTLIASSASVVTAIFVARWLSRSSNYQVAAEQPAAPSAADGGPAKSGEGTA